MKIKIISLLIIILGILLTFITSHVVLSLPNLLLFLGSVLGIIVISNEKGIKVSLIPIISWAVTLSSVLLMRMDINFDWSEGMNALAWIIPIYSGALIGLISTVTLMFIKTKSKNKEM